jgi:hypothetical protein
MKGLMLAGAFASVVVTGVFALPAPAEAQYNAGTQQTLRNQSEQRTQQTTQQNQRHTYRK